MSRPPSIRAAARSSASTMFMSSALSFSGRTRVSVAIWSLKSRRTRSSPVSSMRQLQAHRVRLEQAGLHELEIGRHLERNIGLSQDMLFEIDARRDLAHHEAVG